MVIFVVYYSLHVCGFWVIVKVIFVRQSVLSPFSLFPLNSLSYCLCLVSIIIILFTLSLHLVTRLVIFLQMASITGKIQEFKPDGKEHFSTYINRQLIF